MALSFFTYSKKEQSALWIRYREGKIDAKTRTPLIIDTDRLVSGKILKYRIKQSDNAQQKAIIRDKNKSLDLLQVKMNEVYRTVQDALNNREDDSDIINKEWMKSVVYPSKNDNLLTNHIDRFLNFKKPNIKESSYDLYKQIKRIIDAYESDTNKSYLIKNVDLRFSDNFREWMQVKGYSSNSIRQYLGHLMQVLRFASERGATVSNKIDFFRKGLKKKKTLNVYLSFDEIKLISALELKDKTEDIARDWLVISCFSAQRVSDMFKFNSKDISEDGEWITVQQTKNENSVKISVPIMPQTRAILNKYNGEFPPLFDNAYNRYIRTIKKVCKKAGLNEMTKTLAYKGKTNDDISEVVEKPKHELVGTHIGRRSFATNFYGKIPTALIMSITGHLTESSFLLYINRERLIDKKDFMKQLINATK
tara:strand:- start:4234 stop:5499 length:1266 start_codon:yes stop_codon:yes gene_type:complete